MFEEIKLGIALLGGVICGIYDLKTSNMLDPIAWIMIALGIGLHAYESYLTGNLFILEWCLIVVTLFFLFSLFMYYRGYWGGGDGEMLIAYGALLPFGTCHDILFSLNFFINVFFVGGFYSLAYSLFLLKKEKRILKKVKRELKSYEKFFLVFLGAIAGAFAVAIFSPFSFPLLLAAAFIFLYPPLLKYSKIVENYIFKRRIPVTRLKANDVLGEDIPEVGLKAKLVRGLSEEEVRKIRKVRKYVVVKDGIRFIPVFPIALVLAIFGFPLSV